MTIEETMKLDREIGDYYLRPPSHRGKSEMIRRMREMVTNTVEPTKVDTIQGTELTAIFIDEAAELDEVTIETLKTRHCIVVTDDNHDAVMAEVMKRTMDGQGVAINFGDGIADEIMDRMDRINQRMADHVASINPYVTGRGPKPKKQKRLFRP